MAVKISIALLLVLGSAALIALSMNHTPELKLTVKGNNELGIKLELPYLKESPADVIVTNSGEHRLLAYKIRWESIKYSGEVVERRSIGYHPEALLEKNQEKRRELLIRQPLLPPHTKWFLGLGREHYQITGNIPSLEEVGRDPELFPDIKEYKQINVTLDGAIIENGQVFARNPAAFSKEIDTLVLEHLKFLKGLNK